MTRLSKHLSLCREQISTCAQTSLCSTSQKDYMLQVGRPCRWPQATLRCLMCGGGCQCCDRLARGHKASQWQVETEKRGPLFSCPTPSLLTDCAFRGALVPPVFPNVFISLYRKDSIKFRILTFRRSHGPDMGYYPLSICDSKHSCDFGACHQLICCVWFIQP